MEGDRLDQGLQTVPIGIEGLPPTDTGQVPTRRRRLDLDIGAGKERAFGLVKCDGLIQPIDEKHLQIGCFDLDWGLDLGHHRFDVDHGIGQSPQCLTEELGQRAGRDLEADVGPVI